MITNKSKNTCFYKIIHFSMQFSAIVNRFIVKTKLNSAFKNDLKRKEFFSKIVADLVSLIYTFNTDFVNTSDSLHR